MTFSASLANIIERNENGLLSAHPSWGRVPLTQVAHILNGFPFPSSDFTKERGIPLLRIRDILASETDTYFKGEYDPSFLVHPGDLVVGMDGDFNCTLWRGQPSILNQRVCKISPNEELYRKRFLAYALPGYLRAINAETSSVTVKHLSSSTIAAIPLPLPPIAEQDRIIEDIEKQFTRLDTAMVALKRVQANLKRYRTAVLKAACEGRLVPTEAEFAGREGRSYEPASVLLDRMLAKRRYRERAPVGRYKELEPPISADPEVLPEGWTASTIDQLSDVGTGATPLRSNPSFWDGGTIPWVTSGALNRRVVTEATAFVTLRALRETNLTVYPPGTLLIAMYGEGKTRGKCALLEIEASTNQAIAALQFDGQTAACRPFVRIFLENNYENVRSQSSGGVQPNLNLGLIKRVVVPLPPLAEQHRIVFESEKRLSIIEEVETQVDENLRRATRLRESILKNAFEGRLVPQDPNDEPASVLLSRILAEYSIASVKRDRKPGKKGDRLLMAQPHETRRKSITEILDSVVTGMSPEALFAASGHQPDTVDDFYAELKVQVESGVVEQIRSGEKIVLRAVQK